MFHLFRYAAPQARNSVARRFSDPPLGMQLAASIDDDSRLAEMQRGEAIITREEGGRAVDAIGLQAPAA